MDNNLAARIVKAVRDPGSIAPRNGHKESDAEWAERVVRYVLADAEPLAAALRAEVAEAHADGASSNDIAQLLDDWFVKQGLRTVLYA